MGKHNVKNHVAAKRSRARRDGKRATLGWTPSKYLRRANLRLEKRQTAWDNLPLTVKSKTTRPGSMKMRTN